MLARSASLAGESHEVATLTNPPSNRSPQTFHVHFLYKRDEMFFDPLNLSAQKSNKVQGGQNISQKRLALFMHICVGFYYIVYLFFQQ
jgi:hypothetical protein